MPSSEQDDRLGAESGLAAFNPNLGEVDIGLSHPFPNC